jgi:hypothetical protein
MLVYFLYIFCKKIEYNFGDLTVRVAGGGGGKEREVLKECLDRTLNILTIQKNICTTVLVA